MKADLFAAFGGADWSKLGYEAEVGLWLNAERVEQRRAVAVARGIEQALGGGECFAAYDALTDWLDKKKSDWRMKADLFAAFGGADWSKLGYEAEVGLWLNAAKR